MNQSEAVEVDSERGPSAGQCLQQAREALKLSIDDVAESIRISSSKVAALESGVIHDVGAPVFVAGYIRAYARIVGLSADELVAGFEGLEHLNEGSVPLASGHVSKKIGRLSNELPASFSLAAGRRWSFLVRGLGIMALLLVVAAGAFGLFKSGVLPTSQSTDAAHGLMSLPEQSSAQDELGSEQILAIPGQSATTTDQSEEGGELSIPLPLQHAGNQPSSLTTPAIGSVEAQTTAATTLDELSLHFKDDSWVEIHDARKQRLIHQLARAGQVHTFKGVTPFALVLGYVPGVSIFLNGEAVDLSRYQGRRLVHLSIGEAINVN